MAIAMVIGCRKQEAVRSWKLVYGNLYGGWRLEA
jgi:hypothetical protein